MKTGRTLVELAEELDRQNKSKRDYMADTDSLSAVVNDAGAIKIQMGDQALVPTDIFHRQVGEHLKVPAKYYDRMREEAPDLLATNINHWFDKNPTRRLVRTLDGKARAFLSDRYRTLDNYDLANAVIPVLKESSTEVVSCEVTDRKLYLKAIMPDIKVEIPPAGREDFEWGKEHLSIDVLQPGCVITNSEIGFSALTVSPGTHTVKCSNLATFSEGMLRKTHLGRVQGDDPDASVAQIFSDRTKELSDQALFAQLADVVRASLSGELFDRIVEKIKASRGMIIKRSKSDIIEIVQEKFALTDDEGKSILDHLIEGSAYGLSNAITAASAKCENYDRASEMERLGAKIIELPNRDWQEIAVAA